MKNGSWVNVNDETWFCYLCTSYIRTRDGLAGGDIIPVGNRLNVESDLRRHLTTLVRFLTAATSRMHESFLAGFAATVEAISKKYGVKMFAKGTILGLPRQTSPLLSVLRLQRRQPRR